MAGGKTYGMKKGRKSCGVVHGIGGRVCGHQFFVLSESSTFGGAGHRRGIDFDLAARS